MAKAMEKELAELREQVADLKRDHDALQAKVERMPGYENDDPPGLAAPVAIGKGAVAPMKISAEDLESVSTMTEEGAQQIIEQTKNVKIDVAGKTTIAKATSEDKKTTVPVPTNLDKDQLVVIHLLKNNGVKLFTLAYVNTTRGLKLRDAASQRKFRQQEEYLPSPIASSPST